MINMKMSSPANVSLNHEDFWSGSKNVQAFHFVTLAGLGFGSASSNLISGIY